MLKMINEVLLTGSVRVGITHDSTFLLDFLSECANKSNWIDIATFAINFKYMGEGSVAKKLIEIAEEKGRNGGKLDLRIVYGYDVQNEIEIELEGNVGTLTYLGDLSLYAESFQVKIRDYDLNHCKMILSEKLAYIGSLNLGRSSNYEAGVIIEDTNAIMQIRENLFNFLVEKSN